MRGCRGDPWVAGYGAGREAPYTHAWQTDSSWGACASPCNMLTDTRGLNKRKTSCIYNTYSYETQDKRVSTYSKWIYMNWMKTSPDRVCFSSSDCSSASFSLWSCVSTASSTYSSRSMRTRWNEPTKTRVCWSERGSRVEIFIIMYGGGQGKNNLKTLCNALFSAFLNIRLSYGCFMPFEWQRLRSYPRRSDGNLI